MTPNSISRRDFLKLLAVGGAAAAGGYALSEAAPWLDYETRAGEVWNRTDLDSTPALHKLVRAATLAANGHNTQPWKFALQPEGIEIRPDLSRRLAVVDPENRELWMSLGCALENLLVAAHASGYATQVTYPDASDFIRVHLAADMTRPNPLFDAIPRRQNTRSEYNGQPLPAAELDILQALPLEAGIRLRFVTPPIAAHLPGCAA
jgi:hypothetical protein